MKSKGFTLVKKILCLILVLVICTENFAAIVSDNDGSAFITKSEFEAMKRDFAEQVTNYNDSIDAKIDGAIASYLAGVRLENTSLINSILYKCNEAHSVSFASNWAAPGTVVGDQCEIAVLFWGIFTQTSTNSSWPAETKYRQTFTGFMLSTKDNASTFKKSTIGTRGTYVCRPGYNDQYDKYYMDNLSFWKITPYAYALAFRWHSRLLGLINWNDRASIGHNYISDTSVWELPAGSDFGVNTTTGRIKFTGFQTAPSDQFFNGTYVTGTTDQKLKTNEISNGDNAYILAGNQVTGAVDIVKSDEWNIVSDNYCNTFSTNTGSGFKLINAGVATATGNVNVQTEMTNWPTNLPEVRVYNKKNSQINASDMILNTWTNATGNLIYYWTGIPIFTAISNGVIEIPFNFVVDVKTAGLTNGATYSIKNESFGNNATLDASNVELYEDLDLTKKITNQEFDGNSYSKKVYFRAKSGETYWIKIMPKSTNNVIVNTTSDKLVFYEGRE